MNLDYSPPARAASSGVPTALQANFTIQAHTQVTAGQQMEVGEGLQIIIGEDAVLVRL